MLVMQESNTELSSNPIKQSGVERVERKIVKADLFSG